MLSTTTGTLPYQYKPGALGLSGVTLAAERTSNSFVITGRTKLTVDFILTTRSAATALLVSVDHSPDGTNWIPIRKGSVSSGTETLSTWVASFTTSVAGGMSATTDLQYTGLCRIRVSATNGAAGDIASVWATVI